MDSRDPTTHVQSLSYLGCGAALEVEQDEPAQAEAPLRYPIFLNSLLPTLLRKIVLLKQFEPHMQDESTEDMSNLLCLFSVYSQPT